MPLIKLRGVHIQKAQICPPNEGEKDPRFSFLPSPSSLSPRLPATRWAQWIWWVMDWADQRHARLVMCERRSALGAGERFSGFDVWQVSRRCREHVSAFLLRPLQGEGPSGGWGWAVGVQIWADPDAEWWQLGSSVQVLFENFNGLREGPGVPPPKYALFHHKRTG